MRRPLTRYLLASAIEHAAQSKLKPQEHQKLFAAHYEDKDLEAARSECVRILVAHGSRALPKHARKRLADLASKLKEE
jgi:hypothetical protein